jgi:hypothetical protein
LGVARGTVEVAYQMLAGEGYTIAAGARGTMVNPALSLQRRTRPASILTTSWATSHCGRPLRAICGSRATLPARPTRS